MTPPSLDAAQKRPTRTEKRLDRGVDNPTPFRNAATDAVADAHTDVVLTTLVVLAIAVVTTVVMLVLAASPTAVDSDVVGAQ